MCGSSTPTSSTSRWPTFTVAAGVGEVDPARLAQRRREVVPGSGGAGRPPPVVGLQVAQRVLRDWARSSRWSRRRRRRALEQRLERVEDAGTASRWARLSPVSTTRSGSRAARSRTQSCLRRCPGVRCRSERCRTRSGRCPGAGPGRSRCRSRNERDLVAPPSTRAHRPRRRGAEQTGGHGVHPAMVARVRVALRCLRP